MANMLLMQRNTLTALLVTVLLCLFNSEVLANPKVVCYYTNWSVYRPGNGKFLPGNIDPNLCTHLVYAFGGLSNDTGLKPSDEWQDISKGGFVEFAELKKNNTNLKNLLAIGGTNEGSTRFSPIAANPEKRKEFVKNIITFLRKHNFDGLDLDWQFPAQKEGGKPYDRDNYVQLVKLLREEFEKDGLLSKRPRLLITMAIPARLEIIDKGFDVVRLGNLLDSMQILAYDFHSASSELATNHHSTLYATDDRNIDSVVRYFIESGVDKSKMVLGIPTFGRSYTLVNTSAVAIGSEAEGPGIKGPATGEDGFLSYYEICNNIKNNGWKVEQPDPNAMGPYAYKDNQWVAYDDVQMVRKKAEYIIHKELAGVMFWTIDNDDFRGDCHGKPYPLIEAAKEVLIAGFNSEVGSQTSTASPKATVPLNSKPSSPGRSRRNPLPTLKVESIKSDTDIAEKTKNTVQAPAITSKNTEEPLIEDGSNIFNDVKNIVSQLGKRSGSNE